MANHKREADPIYQGTVRTAHRQAFRPTLVYFLIGSIWILLTDKLMDFLSIETHDAVFFSIAKGLFYVFITSLLIYGLIYPSFKKIIHTRKRLEKINEELEKTAAMYKGLYHDFEDRQVLLKSLIDSIPDLIFYKDRDGVYLGCNSAFERITGKSESDIVGLCDYDLFDPDTAGSFRAMDLDMLEKNYTVQNEESVMGPDGGMIHLDTVKTPYCDRQGNTIGIIGISRDITERKLKEEKILYLNYHDVLTGLYNRAFFQEEKQRLDTPRQLPLSVIIGDINGLKLINDTMGHAEGDNILAQVAAVLKKCCRADDIVSRVGGDEYAVLLPKTDSRSVHAITDRIRKACGEISSQVKGLLSCTTIALGHATKTDPGQSFDKTILTAEEFMYRSKLLDYKSVHNSVLSSIKRTMFEKSNETEEHAERLSDLSNKLGAAVGLSDEDLLALELLSTLHDIGKISIDKNILAKPGPLTDEEWHELKKHPEVGYRITRSSAELKHISEYILSHHERWDGKGYPQGLRGENIPLLSRILSIVDAYDAMTNHRCYRDAMTPEAAADEIRKNAGTQFDPAVAEIFLTRVIGLKTKAFIN